MVKIIIVQILTTWFLLSCQNINRDNPVDQSKLVGSDYRLFQNTPAWDLAKAVQDGNAKKIEEIVNNDPKLIDYQESKFGSTLLILTIKNQQMKAFKILLGKKANINIHDTYNGSSALIKACSSKHYDTKFVEILLKNGANVNDEEIGERREGNSTRLTPLMAAAKTGELDLVELLVRNGADINYQNEFKQSALNESVMQDNYKVVDYLLENGADYKKPIFFRQKVGDDGGKEMYLVDLLREDFFEFHTNEYKYKMRIVDFLKSKGIDYRSTPIPEYIIEKAKKKYPRSWQEYLEKY